MLTRQGEGREDKHIALRSPGYNSFEKADSSLSGIHGPGASYANSSVVGCTKERRLLASGQIEAEYNLRASNDSVQNIQDGVKEEVAELSTAPQSSSMPKPTSNFTNLRKDLRPKKGPMDFGPMWPGLREELRLSKLQSSFLMEGFPINSSYNKLYGFWCKYLKVKKIKVWKDVEKNESFIILVASNEKEAMRLSKMKTVDYSNAAIKCTCLDPVVKSRAIKEGIPVPATVEEIRENPSIYSSCQTSKRAVLLTSIGSTHLTDNLRFRVNLKTFSELCPYQ